MSLFKKSREQLIAFALFFLVAILFQSLAGAYRSEFGSHPDEAAHYVTGLMMHDYLMHAWKASPLHFANDYYSHYPKVGLGIWPPFFYMVQSAWTFLFGTSRESILALIAALSGGLGLSVFNAGKREVAPLTAFCAAAWLLALPLVQQYSAMIMAEMLSALTMFGATIYFGRFLETQKMGDAIAFGLFAAFAILTKGTGVALALMAPAAILLTRRYFILQKKELWMAVALIGVLAGPWTWYFRNQGRGGWEEPSPSWHFTRMAVNYYTFKFAVGLGILFSAFAIIGFIFVIKERKITNGVWAALLSLMVSVLIFQSILPVGLEARHLIPAIPAAMLFVAVGVESLTRFARREISCAVISALFFAGIFFPPKSAIGYGSIGNHLGFSAFRIPQKNFSGFSPIAEKLAADDRIRNILIASDARGEGMFISEMARRDPARASRTVQRASKLLASSTWSGSGYNSFFQNEDAVLKALSDARLDAVVLDNSTPNSKPHQQLLRATLEHHPERFELRETGAITRDGATQADAICVYFAKQI